MQRMLYSSTYISVFVIVALSTVYNSTVHCKCLQGIKGCLQVFPAISMEKDCKNHKETLYSSKGKIVYVVRKPCNIYRLRGNPMIIIGFPRNL